MSRIRDTASGGQPGLVVSSLTADALGPTVERLCRLGARRFDPTVWWAAVHSAAEAHRADDEGIVAALEEELAGLESRRASAELALEDLRRDQQNLAEAADWCVRQPGVDAEDRRREAELAAEVETLSRDARTATRQLERVLEQRAAAEAALEEARRELDGLEVASIDETGVRRRIEAASHDLHLASVAHQEAMKDAARCRIALAQLEATGPAVPLHVGPDEDQFRAMGRAVSDKLASTAVPASALDAARDAVALAEERAERSARELAAARAAVEDFENELAVRSGGDGGRTERRAAAVELEAQVSAVERRLGEAEAAARAEADDTTRGMSRAELALDRLRHEGRARRQRLTDLLGLVPPAERPSVDGDIVEIAPRVADALRAMTAPVTEDIARAEEAIARLRTRCAEQGVAVDTARQRLDAILPEDRVAALQRVLDDDPTPIVFDDVVLPGRAADELITTCDLDGAALGAAAVVVLTDRPEVLSWGIDLPARRGGVLPLDTVLRRFEPGADGPVTDLTDAPAHPPAGTPFPTPSRAR